MEIQHPPLRTLPQTYNNNAPITFGYKMKGISELLSIITSPTPTAPLPLSFFQQYLYFNRQYGYQMEGLVEF